MTPNATHLSILVGRLSLAEAERDIEGQCRAWKAIRVLAAMNELAVTERAWIASAQRQREQTAVAVMKHDQIAGREIGKVDRRGDRSPALGRRVSDKVAARLRGKP